MISWGRRKDNKKSYPKTGPKGITGSGQNTSPISDVHLKSINLKDNHEEFGNNLSKKELELAKEKTKFWSYPKDWVAHKKHQIEKNEPYLYFNETGIHIMRPNDMDYGRYLPNELESLDDNRKGFSIKLTKEVGHLPSYLGGKNSREVSLAHNSEDRNNVALMVGDKAIKFNNYNQAREIYDSLKTEKDIDEFLMKFSH